MNSAFGTFALAKELVNAEHQVLWETYTRKAA